MAASIIDIFREEARQLRTGDTLYYKSLPYAFVLRSQPFKGPLGPSGIATFPLPMNPEDMEYDLPFAAEVTPLQEGGVVSEEGGITVGNLSLTATTGWKLRTNFDTTWGPGDGEFTGLLGGEGGHFEDLSGQMAFWRLANRCFDAYSALKKDPQTAPVTRLEFHSQKDDLHLTVVPKNFTLRRGAARERVTYRWTARFEVVGPATNEITVLRQLDGGLLQSFKNAVATIRKTLQSVAAAVNDITAAIDDIRRTITGIAGILDDVATIVDSFTNLVEGVKAFADIPAAFISATANLVESAATFAGSALGLPADVRNTLMGLADDLDTLKVSGTNLYRETFDDLARKYDLRSSEAPPTDDITRITLAQDLADRAAEAQGTLKVADVFDGPVRPGDVVRGGIQSLRPLSRLQPGRYKGFEERVVGQGDTLQTLAAKHLGSARDWLVLAVVNQLRAPYITNGAQLPGTLQPGKRLIIPIAAGGAPFDAVTTGEPQLGESQADAHLGTDFERVEISEGSFGWAIDRAGGSIDVRKVSGISNLGQALEGRFRTEQGQNILYPGIGLPRLVGQKNLGSQTVEARYEARNQLLADARVERIGQFSFTNEQDRLKLTAKVQPKGYSTTRTISRTLT